MAGRRMRRATRCDSSVGLKDALMIATGLLAVVIVLLVASDAQAKIPANATTNTNVCLVYEYGGIFSGGLLVMEPQTVSYPHVSDGGSALLLLPGQDPPPVYFLPVVPGFPFGDVRASLPP